MGSAVPERAYRELEGRAGDVHGLVTHGYRMHAEFLGHERHRVDAVFGLLDLGVLGDTTGGRDGGGKIEGRDSGYLEGQLALAADLGNRYGLSLPLNLLTLSIAALAADLNSERRALDVVVRELEIHDVVAGLGGLVGDVQSAVFVILALDLGLTRTLHRERETAEAGVPCVDGKVVLHVGLALLQTGTGDLDLLRVAYLAVLHVDLEGRIRYVLTHSFHAHYVLARFARRERHAHVAARHLF